MIEARCHRMLELALPIEGPWSNPFDPRVVAVDARIDGPSGQVLQPCFHGQPHERVVPGAREVFRPAGPEGFFLRWTPREPGAHEIEIAVSREGGAPVVEHRLEVSAGAPEGGGMVRVTPHAPRRLVRDDGAPVVPLGMNLCWWIGPDPTVRMERVLDRMAAAGMTWTRFWLTHFGEGFTPEWSGPRWPGLGRYRLDCCARIDLLLAAAEARGIDAQLVLWQHSQLASPSHSAWAENPYNAARGGPCGSSAEFLSHPEAIRLSEQRLRYAVARWGAFPSLFCWEIWNEMDLVVDAPVEVVAAWCRARAASIRALDAHGHPITVSQAFPASLVPPIASTDDAFDLGQAHIYAEDLAEAIAREAPAHAAGGKPVLLAECGLGVDGDPDRRAPDGRYWHDASWAALVGGFASGAMSWWWDTVIDPLDRYGSQAGAARFVRALGRSLESFGRIRGDVLVVGASGVTALCRASATAVLAWLRGSSPVGVGLGVPGTDPGQWELTTWDPRQGVPVSTRVVAAGGNEMFPVGPFDPETAVTARLL